MLLPKIDRRALHAGMRVAVAVSGGADSVGLLRALVQSAPEIGLVLTVVHVHHGLRGAAADEDEQFVADLAGRLGISFLSRRVDTSAVARLHHQTWEEAGRNARYAWFRDLLAQGMTDAVATGHTLDDQAETVLHRFLRGAWTEGLGGIHPAIVCTGGMILRPFLETRHAEILACLQQLGQPWREDASNQDTRYTRNRIRHELLPHLADYNPRIAEQLARLATIARDEESWWSTELSPMLPSLIQPGRAVRGGGRAVSTHPDEGSVGLELEKLRRIPDAIRRRVLRAAARQLNATLNFDQTDQLMMMCSPARARKQQLASELWAERTARELRLVRGTGSKSRSKPTEALSVPIPGEVAGLGVRLRATPHSSGAQDVRLAPARLRRAQPGDRVRLRHSQKPKVLKEIFRRMNVGAEERENWPLLEWEGRIVWMRGVDVDPGTDLPFAIEILELNAVDGCDGAYQRTPVGGHS